MINNTLNGWLLTKQASGDTSLRAVFFYREKGLVQCLCKGWRQGKKKYLLQPFIPLWLYLSERRGWFYARQIEYAQPALSLQGTALFSALYLNELLYYILKPEDVNEVLFDAYQQTLVFLAQTQDKTIIESQLRRFEWTLLHTCGYGISFTQESGSARKIQSGQYYRFVAGEGFYPAESGISGEHLLAIAADDLQNMDTLNVAKQIMRQAISYLLDGREIKARALFRS